MFEPGIKQTNPMTVAFLAMRGPYAQIPEAMGRLYERTGAEGLVPVGMPIGLYLTDPTTVPESDADWELWAPVAGEPEPREPDASGFGIKRIGSETVAFAMHKGPYDTIDETYEQLESWLGMQGRLIIGPPREAYCSDPADTDPEDYLTEVQLPVS